MRCLWADGRRGGLIHGTNLSLGTAILNVLLGATKLDKEENTLCGEMSKEELNPVSKMLTRLGAQKVLGPGTEVMEAGILGAAEMGLMAFSLTKFKKSANI